MTTYDPALCERLVAMLRSTEINAEAIDEHELADQLEAAQSEVEHLQTRPLLQLVKKISAERDALRAEVERIIIERDAIKAEHDKWCAELGAGWLDGTPEAELAKVIHERDALRAEVELMRPVVKWAEIWRDADIIDDTHEQNLLTEAVDTYRAVVDTGAPPCRYCGDPTHRAQDAVCTRDNT